MVISCRVCLVNVINVQIIQALYGPFLPYPKETFDGYLAQNAELGGF